MTHLNAPNNLTSPVIRFFEFVEYTVMVLAGSLKSTVEKAFRLLWCLAATVLELVRSI